MPSPSLARGSKSGSQIRFCWLGGGQEQVPPVLVLRFKWQRLQAANLQPSSILILQIWLVRPLKEICRHATRTHLKDPPGTLGFVARPHPPPSSGTYAAGGRFWKILSPGLCLLTVSVVLQPRRRGNGSAVFLAPRFSPDIHSILYTML